MTTTYKNRTGRKTVLAVFVALFAMIGLIGLLPKSSAAPGLLPDMRGSWKGRFAAAGIPLATPIGITMDVNSQGIGGFSGTYSVLGAPSGTLSGTVGISGSVTFQGDSADVDLLEGKAKFRDYGGGAAIIGGTVTIASTNPFFTGPSNILAIRPFKNEGNCPCTPRTGEYLGNWGNSGSGGTIRFNVAGPDHALPTRFTTQVYMMIAGQQHAGALIGTGNGDGDIVAMGHSNTGEFILEAVLTEPPFMRPSVLSGTFTYEQYDGTVIKERFSAARQ